MFSKILSWVKTHKLLTFNILVVSFIFFGIFFRGVTRQVARIGVSKKYYAEDSFTENYAPSPIAGSAVGRGSSLLYPVKESVSQVPQEDRKVIMNSSLSLLVKNVDSAVENIRKKTLETGGFMVNTNVSRDVEDSSAVIEVRVPSAKLVEFSEYLKTLSVKVVYENITGTDITDQYVDYEERLRSLEVTKERFEEIMEEAETVDEIMYVQSRIFEIQSQIESIKGQITYMNRSTVTSKVTITISTDELSLPYAPVKSWRPDVIVKKAVRSLISVFRAVGTVTIWVLVFLPLVLFVIAVKIAFKYLLKKRKARKETVKNLR